MAKDFSKKLYVQAMDDFKRVLSRERFSNEKLGVKIVERGIILPVRKIDGALKGGVCDNDLNFVAGSSRVKNNTGGGGLLSRPHTPSTGKNYFSLTRT